ncbi:MAG: elongation factor P [Candidatus Omnitrophota bacterium]|nr:MAG: elongation factor P [Candidatus Omnitrophota bacterium]
MIPVNQIKIGMVIKMDSRLYAVLGFSHTKPGKGGAFLRLKLKDVVSGQVVEKTISTDDKVKNVYMEERTLVYLYNDGQFLHFMDEQNYEEIEILREDLEDIFFYLKENSTVTASFHEGKIITVTPPNSVILEVVETEPGFKGDTVKAGTKPARLETGLVVQVPLFIKVGDKVKIDTRTGEYLERV